MTALDELILAAYCLLSTDSGYMLITLAWIVEYYEQHRYN